MREWIKENVDISILVPTLLLTGIGALSVYSATYDAAVSAVFHRQLIWIGIGLLLLLVTALIPFRTLQLLSFPLYGISLLTLAAVLVAGKTVAGSTSWFGVKGLGLQPSELAKVATVLAAASFMARPQTDLRKFRDVAALHGIVLAPVLLIILQPDMGTAVIYLGMLFLILVWAGAPALLLLSAVAPAVAAVSALFGTTAFAVTAALVLAALFLLRENRFLSSIVFSTTVLTGVCVQFIFGKLAPHQQKRILTFINPDSDPLGAGYNVIQSKIAIGSGGFFGKGFLQGSQTQLNFIPAQWTDFIFCVPGEEFGFVGACLILVLLTFLLWRGVRIASTVKSRYANIAAIGVVSILAVHFTINIGMSMGIVPVIGVPLPFLSYGGSNMLTNMIMAGILMNMYANRKEY